jgi:NAD(P)H dehydrogenase (quinone)
VYKPNNLFTMILITGASGHLGQLISTGLTQKVGSASHAVLVRTTEKGAAYAAEGITVRLGDYHQPDHLVTALQGVTTLVLISSSDFNNRLQQHQNVIDAAVTAGVQHVLYTGISLHGIEDSPLRGFVADHFQTEAYIKASGIPYTFLQHSLYAEVVPLFIGEQVLSTGLFFPAGDGRVPFATRADLAEAIVNVLTTTGHANQVYPLTNSTTYTFADVAAYLQELSGREVAYVSPSPEAFVSTLQSYGVPEPIIQMPPLLLRLLIRILITSIPI